MKKFFSLFILILSTTFASAQINIGVKAGTNYAYFPNIEFSDDFNFKTKPFLTYHIGGLMEFEFSKHFALNTEVLYSVKGSHVDQSTSNNRFVSTFATGYISVPIAAKFKVGKLGILGGFEPSLLVNERVRFNGIPWERAKGLSNTTDFSLIGGLDLRLKKLYFAARYIYGLANALEIRFTDENGQPLGNGTNPNRVFQFSVGYFFL